MEPGAEELLENLSRQAKVAGILKRAAEKVGIKKEIYHLENNNLPTYAMYSGLDMLFGPKDNRLLQVNFDAAEHLPETQLEAAFLHVLFHENLRNKLIVEGHDKNKALFVGSVLLSPMLSGMGKEFIAAFVATNTALYTISELLLKRHDYGMALEADLQTAAAQGSAIPSIELLALQYEAAEKYISGVRSGENPELPSDFYRTTPSPQRRLETLRQWHIAHNGEDPLQKR